ncbi:hypothetical protein [Thermococcus sp. JCM 11816]|uniref:hypothetical protein n=1 Tax=Thermococcus sp. (strain JCM 11816 / KS-1) TaxID=1295125 RepID=UPI0006CFFF8D
MVTFIKTRLPREVWNDIDEIVYDYLCDPPSLANLYERDPSVVLRRAMFFYVEKPNTKPLRDKAKTLWGVGGILVVIGAVLLVVGGRKENG